MVFLALRHLLSRKKQTFFILLGVMLGTFVYVFISGVQLGFREFIIEQLVENDAHVKISGREENIEPAAMSEIFFGREGVRVSWVTPPAGKRDEARVLYPQGWFQRLSREPEVAAFAEQMSLQVIASKGSVKNSAVLIGIVPEKQTRVTILEKYMVDGKLSDLGSSGNRVVAGSGVLKKLGAQVGDTLRFASTGTAPQPFKVVGAFTIGVQQMDDSFVYGALRDVQQLNATPGREIWTWPTVKS
jgi:lipoprotein-releasing system permease protein